MNRIIELLNKYNIRPNKRLGQNFLIDLSIADKIIKESKINKSTTVIEIGGGVGSLTGALLEAAKKVIVIELDSTMCEILKSEYKGNLAVINADILKTDINNIVTNEEEVVVCGNLPYYITTPIIMYFLERTVGIKSLAFMMQKEVADRVTAVCGTKSYGAITPIINYYADVFVITRVPADCFIPKPSVLSAVVGFDLLKTKRVDPKNEALMLKTIRSSFEQRRKTMLNALYNTMSQELRFTKDQLLECFSISGIDPTVRGETLSLYDFCKLADELFELCK